MTILAVRRLETMLPSPEATTELREQDSLICFGPPDKISSPMEMCRAMAA